MTDNATGKEVVQSKPKLTKFNLDFPGGTPAQLVKAIEQATGKPLNVIIPNQSADVPLPPLKMNHVDVAQLFKALSAASPVFKLVNGVNSRIHYDFGTSGEITDHSIWYFESDQSPPPPNIYRFYSLAPYLERGFTVDDITTAIRTGWKMAGITSPPKLEYHKETKLLIAYGEPSQLQTIEDVLQALPKPAVNVWKTLEMEKKAMSILNSNSPPPSSNKEKSGK